MTNTSFRHRWLWGALYGLAGLVASPPAWAQAEEGTSTSTHAIEELTITANLRQQRLQDFAAPAVVISSQDIQDAGIRTTEDFVALVPNLTFDDTFTYLNSFVVLRGVTQINNADPPVAVIVDGVPQNNQKQLKQSLFDIQQVEVVKGPQGSLYGRNAIGGAINIRTRQPTNEFEGVLQLGLENGLGYRAQAGLSGPIVKDLVLFRVSGSFYRTDGLIENTFLGANVDTVDYDYAVRGKLSIRPLDILTVDLRASYNEFDAGSSYDTVVNNEPNGAAVPVFRTGMANDVFAPTSDFRGFTTGRVADLSGKVDLELPFGVATYILGFTDLQEQYRADLDFSNPTMPSGIFGGLSLGQGQNLDLTLFSHELRVVSHDDQRLRWHAGAYLLATERDLQTRAFLDMDNSPEQFESGMILADLNEENSNFAWAFFGQLEFDISDALTVQVGARFDRDEREQVNANAEGVVRTSDFEAFQPKVTLSYRVIPEILSYATYSTGFRSGGFNAPGVVLESFDDEYLNNFELGVKTQFLDGRATVNLAGFFSQSRDFQFFFVDATTGSQIISNLEEVHIWGADLDLSFRPLRQLVLFGGFGLTDSNIQALGNDELESFLSASGVDTSGIEGNRSPRTTEFTLNTGAQVRFDLSSWLSLMFRATYELQGNKYWQIDNLDVRDPVHLIGLRASVGGESWSVAVWGRNLLDEAYYADFNPAEFAGTGFDLGFQARPLSFGLDLRGQF